MIEDLVGKTLASAEGEVGGERIRFVTTDGDVYLMHHRQDCCESVSVEDICGDLQCLVGSPIVTARETTNTDDPKKEDWDESHTWTFYDLATALGHVTIRWYGSSNGYYSETVDFEKIPA
ncbi:MAG: DUF7448 domain-containing protein [Actinomycetota bacterium]